MMTSKATPAARSHLARPIGALLPIAAALLAAGCGDTSQVDPQNTPETMAAVPVDNFNRDRPEVTPTESAAEAEPTDCNSHLATPFVGKQADAQTRADLLGAVSPNTFVRWISPDTVVTQEFRPDRLTVTLDGDGRIESARCG